MIIAPSGSKILANINVIGASTLNCNQSTSTERQVQLPPLDAILVRDESQFGAVDGLDFARPDWLSLNLKSSHRA